MDSNSSLFDEIPQEICGTLINVFDSIHSIEQLFEEAKKEKLAEKLEDPEKPLDKIQHDLVYCYAINALFFVYLRCKGIDAKQHPIMQEITRVMTCMKRCQLLVDKSRRPTLDKPASKRFVKHALWQAAHEKAKKRQQEEEEGEDSSSESEGEGAEEEGDQPVETKRPRTSDP